MQSSEEIKQQKKSARLAELQNLNGGLHVKSLHSKIHPTIVSNILDHFLRRPAGQSSVVGTLLGSCNADAVNI